MKKIFPSDVFENISKTIWDYLHSRDWKLRFSEFIEEFYTFLAENLSLSRVEIDHKLALNCEVKKIFDAMILDHYCQHYADKEPRNVIDSYLSRRGWKETHARKAYLEILRIVPMSVYEVLDTKPGEWIQLQDLLRPFPPFQVTESMGSHDAIRTQKSIARILPYQGRFYFTCSSDRIDDENADLLVKSIRPHIPKTPLYSNSPDPAEFYSPESKINQILRSFDDQFILAKARELLLNPVIQIK